MVHILARPFVAIILVAAVACARRPLDMAPGGPILLAVVSWNMHEGRGDLARLLDDMTAGRLTSTAPADVILLLQEVVTNGRADVTTLAKSGGLSMAFAPVRTAPGRVSGNAILSTRELTAIRTVDLPRERQPRRAVVAQVTIRGTRLFVATTHLENRLGFFRGLFADRARRRQAAALLEQLPPGDGILGGDMNTMLGPDEPALDVLRARFPDTPADANATFHDRLALDRLFFDLPSGWTGGQRVLADTYGSDHHPVVGELRAGG